MKQNEHNINPVIKGLEHDNDSYRDRVSPEIENTAISLQKKFLATANLTFIQLPQKS